MNIHQYKIKAAGFAYYTADVKSSTGYYPFHSIMPNRSFNSTEYRYGGANGQEKIDEINGVGNHYTAEYWEYDPRLGRRWNLDPVDQISISNYAVFVNNPVYLIDPNGDSPTDFENQETNEKIHINDGKDQTVSVSGEDWGQVKKFQSEFKSGNSNPQGYSDFVKSRDPVQNSGDDLPPFSNLEQNYPKYGIDYPNGGVSNAQFANMVGGKLKLNVDNGIFENTCACRVSHSLNLSGQKIPYIKNQTSSGKNGDKYIFRVTQMEKYLTSKYGAPNVISTDMSNFEGLKGIILFDTRGLWSDASGHSTLWDGNTRLGGNYEPSFYFNNSNSVKLWVTE